MTAERAYEDDARFANPADHHIAHVEQCVHDLRVVRAPQASHAQAVDHRRAGELGQLKILQEIITLSVFVPFSIFYMKERLTLDTLWAGLCLAGAVFLLFRSRWVGT